MDERSARSICPSSYWLRRKEQQVDLVGLNGPLMHPTLAIPATTLKALG